MPPPQLNGKTQTRERPTYEEMVWENLQETKTEVRETRRELNARMDRIERRMDKLEEELKTTRQELTARMDKQDEKIDALTEKIDSATKHGNIMMVSVIGIALGVLYVIFFK